MTLRQLSTLNGDQQLRITVGAAAHFSCLRFPLAFCLSLPLQFSAPIRGSCFPRAQRKACPGSRLYHVELSMEGQIVN